MCSRPHSASSHQPHNTPSAKGLQMGSPVVPSHRRQPHCGMGRRTRRSAVSHHDTHLAPPDPHRNRHPLQPVRTGQNTQTRAPLSSTPPLLPRTGTTDTDLHVSPPNPGNGLNPPLHILLSHTRATTNGTHHRLPSRTANHLERNRGLHHPHHTTHDPIRRPHHGPHHIRLPAHEPMPPRTAITSGPYLLNRCLIRPM